MTGEPVLSARELNRALLRRQFLLERSELPMTGVIDRMGAVQAQYAPSAYVGLWSRLAGFRRDDLTSALEDRRVIQGTMLRTTIHLTSAEEYWLFAVGVRRPRREWWLRVHGLTDAAGMDRAAAIVRRRLEDGPRRRTDLVRLLTDAGYPSSVWPGVGLWVDMVRVPPSGTWERRRADLYHLAEAWVGPCTAGEEQGLEHLVRRYLGAFGPAPVRDIANWAGIPVRTIASAVDRLDLRRFRDEAGGRLLDLPGADLPGAGEVAPVRFLPTWDATLLAHCRRTEVLPEHYRPLVFHTRNPQSTPTFLIDGAVAGAWRWGEGGIELEPFGAIPRKARDGLESERRRLAAFHDG